MKRMGYREAVEWIARNDETAEMDPETLASLVSVVLIADLSGKEPLEVARSVVRFRRTHKEES